MNCEAFDQDIDLTLQSYGEDGVSVKLLSVRSAAAAMAPYESISVTVGVTMLTAHLPRHADTWHYGHGVRRITEPRPSGIRGIDRSRLIGICEAVKQLPDDVVLSDASAELYWPMLPAIREPTYHFRTGRASMVIGAYSGNTYGDWSLQQQLSALVPMLS